MCVARQTDVSVALDNVPISQALGWPSFLQDVAATGVDVVPARAPASAIQARKEDMTTSEKGGHDEQVSEDDMTKPLSLRSDAPDPIRVRLNALAVNPAPTSDQMSNVCGGISDRCTETATIACSR